MSDSQIQKVKDDMVFVESIFRRLLKILPSFDITNEKILPYGYINPTNDKIQAFYHHKTEERSREEFLQALRLKSKSIVLK